MKKKKTQLGKNHFILASHEFEYCQVCLQDKLQCLMLAVFKSHLKTRRRIPGRERCKEGRTRCIQESQGPNSTLTVVQDKKGKLKTINMQMNR